MVSPPPAYKLLRSAPRRSRLNDLREKIARVLSNRLHTHFTDHSIDHSDRLAVLAQQLASPLRRKLSSEEAFVLYAACYFHDSGMHNENAGIQGRLAARL